MKLYITGHGCVTGIGSNPSDFMQNITQLSIGREGKEGIIPSKISGFRFYDRELLKRFYKLDISCQYLLEAVRQALEQASPFPDDYKVGIIVGTSTGPINIQKRFFQHLEKTGEASSILFQLTANNVLSGVVACVHHFTGFNTTVYNGLTSSLDALTLASILIKNKQIDAAVVAGVETILAQNNANIDTANQPSFNEGAAAIIVESSVKIEMRKVQVMGEVILGQQMHFYNDGDIWQYIREIFAGNPTLDYLFINRDGKEQEMCSKLLYNPNRPAKIINFSRYAGGFGAVNCLLQIILAIQYNSNSSLIISQDKNRMASLILKDGNYE